jgi:predicted flap endonuclease-1-like 5' DNA nuclease
MDTKLIIAFLVGLLIGWLVEWVIDWLYYRRKSKKDKEVLQSEIDRLMKDNATLQTQVAEMQDQTLITKSAFADVVAEAEKDEVRDDLTRIKGIGPVIAQKLNDAGINTFSELGALTPAQFEEIVGDDVKLLADEEEIIMRTNVLTGDAPSDDLKQIRGIGPKIENKLNDAGVFTFADLADLTPVQLEVIVGDDIQKFADEDDLLKQAAELASSQI